MKKIIFTITPSRKETQEERKERVQNDKVRGNIYINHKKYSRKKKYKEIY